MIWAYKVAVPLTPALPEEREKMFPRSMNSMDFRLCHNNVDRKFIQANTLYGLRW